MSRTFSVRTAGAVAVLAGGALVPALTAGTASAQPTATGTLAVNAPCYITANRVAPSMTITGSGYEAGDTVSLSDAQGGIDAQTTVNAAGQIAVTVKAPTPDLQKPGVVTDKITADDFTNAGGEIEGTATANLTQFDFGNSGTKKAPGLRALEEKTTWMFSGFPVGRTIWGHYLYHGKAVARQSFGKASGPCGTLKVRRRAYPATPHHKAYVLQADASKRYSAKTKPSGRIPVALSFF